VTRRGAGHHRPWDGSPWEARAGRNGARHRPPRRAFGCLFALFFIVAGSAFVVVASVVLAVVGFLGGGNAPGVVQVAAFVVLGVGLLAFLAAGRWLRGAAGTLDDLVAAAARVEAGDYDARVAMRARGPRPLRDLVHGFNTMAERLEADARQRRSLLADVSHELRTPLAVVQGNLEAIADGVHPADEAHVAALLEETRVLARLVDDLRTVSLSETGSLPLHREPTDLAVLVADVVSSLSPGAGRAGVVLGADVDDGVPLLDVDPVRIREVLANVVANALRWTPAGGSVTIAATVREAEPQRPGVRVTVVDTGAGIAPDVLPHVFDRFWKSPQSRGSGLGLAIARNLVVAHGGDMGIESEPARGTTVWFVLPLP
jgi:signal transduction histidine kinase